MPISKLARFVAKKTATSPKMHELGEWFMRKVLPNEYYAGKIQDVANPYKITVSPGEWKKVDVETVSEHLKRLKEADFGSMAGSVLVRGDSDVELIPSVSESMTPIGIRYVRPSDFLLTYNDTYSVPQDVPEAVTTEQKIQRGWELSDDERPSPELLGETLAQYKIRKEKEHESDINNLILDSRRRRGKQLFGEALSQEFREPALKQLVGSSPRYFMPLKHYMEEKGLSELDALKQLIIDRNTLFRMYGVSGNSDQEVRELMDKVSDKYALEFKRSMNGNVNAARTRTQEGLFPLYATSSPNGGYGNPRFVYRASRGQYGNQLDPKFSSPLTQMDYEYPAYLPPVILTRRAKLQPEFDFSGDPTTWFDKNPTIPLVEESTPEDKVTISTGYVPYTMPITKKYYPLIDPVINRRRFETVEFPTITLMDTTPFYTQHHEVNIEGPAGQSAPLSVVDFEDFLRRKNIYSDKEVMIDLAYDGKDVHSTKFEKPFVPYGFRYGGTINKNNLL